ncbi:PRC-barrel domain-containing protein [Halorutilales archaeon Cl-col2-1]|nr:PRC-barrel domain-containing protein [Halobacteria archaeon]
MQDDINRLMGYDVYSTNGVFVGKVDDVQIDVNERSISGLGITDVNQDLFEKEDTSGKGVILPYRWVSAVGDIILVKDVVEQTAETPE